ncbi:PREDICTED: E3 ubiquitin-protein ligase NEURL3 [Bison bison bison]|uniref:E3 ubiquitin-protein ligase NEURL3 n=1 Tax=Bison bison bison TaxID=43346 RepID=A0A6P3GMZ0_BISBB|nr:PREDICTED: E3 ubiquitin-protein ligase NEURL3 [Bison bison bison]
MPEEPRRMGAQICSQADAESPREALRFHAQAVGAQVRLDAERSTAYRRATFHDGIVFSQRPVRPGERVALHPTANGFPTTMPRGLSDEALPGPKAGEECAICFHQVANTCLVPCGHTHFCSSCAWRVFRDTARCPMCRWEIKAVAPAWDPLVLGAGDGLPV